jgi:Glycosyl hydrolase family 47
MPGARCLCSGICDGDEVAPQHVPARLLHAKPSHDRLKSRFWSGACGSDGLGCVTEPSERRQRIREAARSSWRAYKRYAWGADQLAPLSRSGAPCPWVPYNAGMSLLDAADTLWLLGLDKEYAEARTWLARHMTPAAFGSPAWDFNADTFTLSMTFLGSLLSLADLTGDGMYAAAAAELGSRCALIPS